MPDIEANTIAMLSSMQLKMSGLTTDPVTFEGSDLRTKNMRMKLIIVTLAAIWLANGSDVRQYSWGRPGKKAWYVHRSNEQLDAHCDLVVQAHLQIHDPHNRNAEDDDIGDKVGYASPKPPCTRLCAMATRETHGPRCGERGTLSEIVYDGAYQKPTHSDEGADLDQYRVLSAGTRHEYPPVKYDQRKLKQAKRGSPGELFDE